MRRHRHEPASVTDSGWSAEVAIPFSELCAFTPARGAVWGSNFGRSVLVLTREFSAWTATSDWHRVEEFGRLVL